MTEKSHVIMNEGSHLIVKDSGATSYLPAGNFSIFIVPTIGWEVPRFSKCHILFLHTDQFVLSSTLTWLSIKIDSLRDI